ncbi:efflux RND transporter permease subunit [Micrococcoides hystricis]|uniref:Efflux RND transporter permease subunit n=1 Tax=Micrococcoides hystricis TaxID=1572761 RepID=A0ABV6PE08_9MICC
MQQLTKYSLANRALIALITVFIAIFGYLSLGQLKQELVPSIEFPQIAVTTTLPGASPEVVNKQIAEPLERGLQAVENLESTTATSRSGVAVFSLMFRYGTDLDRARAQVDRVISNTEASLPDEAETVSFAGSVNDFPIVFMAVSKPGNLNALQGEVERLVQPELEKIPGVRTAEVAGGSGQYISIVPNERRMAQNGLTNQDITDALETNAGLFPIGLVPEGELSLPVQAGAPVEQLDDLEKIMLRGEAEDAQPISLGRLADISLKDQIQSSITRTDGEPTLSLSVTKTPDADTVKLSHAINDMLPQLQDQLGDDATITVVLDQAPFIEQSIETLATEGMLGLVFAVLVILLFLFSIRSTLVTAISIPLSLLVSFIGLQAFGYSLNMLTLGALTIAIGRVVDDSIVVIENIQRHITATDPAQLADPAYRRTLIRDATGEVATAITSSTLTTVAVFLPVAFVTGMAGELFRPFAITSTVALLGSLLVALTIVPVLAYWFLARKKIKAAEPDADTDELEIHQLASAEADQAFAEYTDKPDRLQRAYLPILRSTQRHPVITLLASVLILVGTFAMVPLLQTNLFGDTGQNSFRATLQMEPGTALEVTEAEADKVSATFQDIPGVTHVQYTAGGSLQMMSFGGGTSDKASFNVLTDADEDQTVILDAARERVADLDTAGEVTVQTQSTGFGSSSSVDVSIQAPSPELLAEATDAVTERMRGLSTAGAVSSNLAASYPTVEVKVDREKAAELGLSEEQIAGLTAASLNPTPAGTMRLGFVDYPVNIGDPDEVTGVKELREVELPVGPTTVKLSDVAEVNQVETLSAITSQDTQRTATVEVEPKDDNLGATIAEVTAALEEVDLPTGASAEIGGAAQQQAESFQDLFLALAAAVAIVYVIMVATFRSLIQPLILLVSIPFAATGAIALLLITGTPLGLPSLIGMLMLVGIVVTNAIVLLDLINKYRRGDAVHGVQYDLNQAIEEGARHRLRPILMTALATILALTPMALGLTGSGGFISQPLAVVVIGGLVSSTLLTLILVPVLYRLVEGLRKS